MLRAELGACGVTNAVVSLKRKGKMAATVLLWKRRGEDFLTVAMTQVGERGHPQITCLHRIWKHILSIMDELDV